MNIEKSTIVDKTQIDKLADVCKLSKITVEALLLRGIDSKEKIEAFLHSDITKLCDFSKIKNVAEACARITQAINNNEKIVIYGDYDCDGICSISIFMLYLRSCGADVSYYIPDRHTEGYGLNIEALEYICENYFPDLIITVDCGITSCAEVEYIQDVLGVDVIVTDHHEPMETLPNCLIVNPKIDANCFSFYCGAGIVLRLVQTLSDTATMLKYIDIATIATIADVVPLVDDNRILVKLGIDAINNTTCEGLKLLLKASGKAQVNSTDIAFSIAPKINAVGRLGSAIIVVDLFVENDYFMLSTLVEKIVALNTQRQELTADLLQDCLEKLQTYDVYNKNIIVLYSDLWQDGVLGIVASKLVEQFNKPVILLTKDGEFYKGSGRSIDGVNIFECVKAVNSYLVKFGGHSKACGLTVSAQNIESFVLVINEYMQNNFNNALFLPKITYDIECDISALDTDLAKEFLVLEPFGEGNQKPTLMFKAGEIPFVRIAQTNHIKYQNKQLSLLGFNSYQNLDLWSGETQKQFFVDIAYEIYKNYDYCKCLIKNVIAEQYENVAVYAKFFNQLNKGDESVFNIKETTQEQCLQFVQQSFGTLFVAFNFATFKTAKEFFANHNAQIITQNFDTLNPLNKIVFGLNEQEDLRFYKNIVFLDGVLAKQWIDYLNISKNCQIYVVKGAINDIITLISSVCPNYQTLGNIFKAIKNAPKQYKTITEIGKDLSQSLQVDIKTFYLAFFVFYDLKLVKFDESGYIFVDSKVTTSLDNSAYYKKLLQLVRQN
ncbi:MAG: single-stranded-DNA-specific exonuclease RecJ [Clostridia bacterium]